jgi:hypothetical protein
MVQEITTTSWGKRIINALFGVLFGIILILGGVYLVFWNEGHGLHVAQSLQQAEKILVIAPITPIDPKNEQRVVYLNGLATTNDILHDSLFNVSEKAIQLNRHVEMYQWSEETESKTEKKLGGSEQDVTTYSYHQIWSSELIDSTHFKEHAEHQNPTVMPVTSKLQYAKNVTLGDYSLPAKLITQMTGDTAIDLAKTAMATLSAKLHKPVQSEGDGLYIGENNTSPKIGDMRVTMTMVLPQTVSIIAEQTGASLQAYIANAGHEVMLIEMGLVSSQQMIHNALSENQMMTWGLRLAAFIMLVIGFALIMSPLAVLADFVPFFGSLVGFGTGVIAFICAISVWTISVAIAWFAVRPMFAVGIIVIALVICYLLYTRRKKLNVVNKHN